MLPETAHALTVSVQNKFQAASQRQSGILMDVHRVALLEKTGCVVTPSLSNSTPMNSNNLLELLQLASKRQQRHCERQLCSLAHINVQA